MPDRDHSLRRLARAARTTALRLRLDAAIGRAFLLLPLVLVYAIGALTFIKVARPGVEIERWLALGGVVPLAVWLFSVARTAFGRRPPHHGALALDRQQGLHDRITTALSFSELPRDQRTPLMELAIDDAVQRATKLAPRRAAPVRMPRELPIALLLVAALVGISFLEVRTVKEIAPQRRIEPLAMTADDVELLRDTAAELQEKSQDPDTLAAVRRFNQLIEDIAERRLDRREVFQRLEGLERQLAKSAETDREALEQGLKNMARELEKSDLAKPVAQPLQEKRLADAEQALKKLAERLKQKQDPPSKAQLEKLRKALEEASKQSSERLKALEQRRQELSEQRKRLLKKKEDGKLTPQEQKELAKQERQLERLERDVQQAKKGKQQLSKLDKELAEAARKLMDEMGKSGENLQQGAEDINRMAREQTSDQEKREMLRKIQEMRELIRQQGKAGQQRVQRLMRFSQRARGQSGDGKQGPGGKDGQGKQGQGKQGQGQQGQGQGAQGGMTIGPDGKPIPMAGAGKGTSAGEMPGGAQPGQSGGDQPGSGSGQGGEKWGSGHDENLKGEASRLKGETKDVAAAGVDTGQGSASSEVIYGAAQRGFRGRGYKNVYTEYREVAEEVIEKDQIPPGYRFYVQRYFQLIRPRD